MQERLSFLQMQIAAHTFPAARQRQLITYMGAGGPVGPGSIHGERTPVFISHPKLQISRSGVGALISSLTQYHLHVVLFRRCYSEARWCYSAGDYEAWAWPSSLCTGYTSPLPWVCLLSCATVHKTITVQPPGGPIAWRLPPRGHGRDRGSLQLQ